MKIRLDDLEPGKLEDAYVHDCQVCRVRFISRKNAKFCSVRCGNTARQRAFRARVNGAVHE